MRTVIAFLVLAFVRNAICERSAEDGSWESYKDNACIDIPCGPYVCQAKCAASCLNGKLWDTVDECVDKFCKAFGETVCNINDTACWRTCGDSPTDGDSSSPKMLDDLRLDYYADGYSSSSANPNLVHLEWSASEDAKLYLLEAFPMNNGEDVLRNLTTDTKYDIERTDICTSYMIRVMGVNGFGVSPPRYLVVDAWKPEMHFDEFFDIRWIKRENDWIKVSVEYSPPDQWKNGDVELEDSLVKAHDCLGPIDVQVFMDTDPDEDGYYTPLVYIDQIEKTLILTLPAKIMDAKCLFSYRVSSLRTKCNTTIALETKETGAGVDFSINCLSVENSECDSNSNSSEDAIVASEGVTTPDSVESTEAPESSDATEGSDQPQSQESSEETRTEASSTEAPEVTESPESGTTPDGSPEEAQTEAAQESAQKSASIEKANDEKKGSEEKQSGSDENEQTEPTEKPDSHERSTEEENNPKDEPTETPGSNERSTEENPPLVAIEPQDPNSPMCKMDEFDAELIKHESKEATVNLAISWMESKTIESRDPKYFIIRYGPIERNLVLDDHPEISDAKFKRTDWGKSSENTDEIPRALKITGLNPDGLYAFQICAIYKSEPDALPWDTVGQNLVDLTAGWASDPSNEASELENTPQSITPDSGVSTDASVDSNLVINLPMQPPTLLKVDVQPVVVRENSAFASLRALWLFMALALLAVTMAGFMAILMKRSRNRRLQKDPQYQSGMVNPIMHQAPLEVKIPIPDDK